MPSMEDRWLCTDSGKVLHDVDLNEAEEEVGLGEIVLTHVGRGNITIYIFLRNEYF